MHQLFANGRLYGDPESIGKSDDKPMCKFKISTQNFGHTEWFNCIAYGKTAEIILKFCRDKTTHAFIGNLKTRKHNDKYYTDFVIDRIGLGNKEHGAPAGSDQRGTGKAQTYQDAIGEDDIPF